MKKIIFSDSLINRLNAAKDNGSKIADIILKERTKKHSVALAGSKANYFDTLLTRNCGVPSALSVTCCNKEDSPMNPTHGNPQFPYLKENRTRLSLSNFATMFPAVNAAAETWGADELDYELKLYQECMLIGEKISFRVGTTCADFKFAYLADNYIPFRNDSTLGSSCMQYENMQETIGDFYSFFAGAKILIGQTASGMVVSRAILWDGVTDTQATDEQNVTSFIDRVYVSHSHLYRRMYDEAKRLGYKFRKQVNTFDSQQYFTNLETLTNIKHNVYKTVPVSKWHKGGAPYMDTMYLIVFDESTQEVKLANYRIEGTIKLYNLQSTSGYGSETASVCPVCGKVHCSSDDSHICPDCRHTVMATSFWGTNSIKRPVVIKGIAYPREMTHRGKLTKIAQLAINIAKIGEPNA